MTTHAPHPDFITDAATSQRMARIRQRDTEPELRVRSIFRDHGASYRTRNRDLPGSPDLANRKRRWAVFVHGCYWHRHFGCHLATTPKRNRKSWISKFNANIARDTRNVADLRARQFRVLTVWQCELDNEDVVRGRIRDFLQKAS